MPPGFATMPVQKKGSMFSTLAPEKIQMLEQQIQNSTQRFEKIDLLIQMKNFEEALNELNKIDNDNWTSKGFHNFDILH